MIPMLVGRRAWFSSAGVGRGLGRPDQKTMGSAREKSGGSLRRSLIVAAFGIAFMVLGSFLGSVYFVFYKPWARELAITQLRAASQQIEARLQSIVHRRDWGARGLFDVQRPEPFNDLFRTILVNGPNLGSVVVADQSGREILLMPGADGRWINRLTDPDRRGKQATFLTWSPSLQLEKEEVKDLDYDARQRPWFQGAMALASDRDIFWTAPFIYRSTQEPGVSAVVRWTSADGRTLAMTSDLKLSDLSRFTREIVAGKTGFAGIITGDGKVIGVPRDQRFASDGALKTAVLRPISELGLAPLESGFALWNRSGRGNDQLLRFEVGGDSWLGIFKSIQFGSQVFWVATLAPASDFLPAAAKDVWPVAALFVVALLVAGFIATRLSRRFTGPLETLARESARIGQLQLEQPVAVRSRWRELNQLGEAQEQMRLALLAATRRLEDANESLEAKVAERTRALEASEAAARAATRAKTDFLANTSHEIRTPMNAIIGMAHLAAKAGLPPRQHDQVMKIQQAGHHLLGIIDDILDSSKIEAGQMRLERRPFDLADVMANVASLIGQRATAKGLDLSFEIDPAIPKALIGDPLRLGQIVLNYASNAVKFTERGDVRVQARLRDATATEVFLEIAVADTGIGLTVEETARLFQPFQQADTSTTRRFGGSGLGLVIARNLAELMGGAAGVESAPGQGSRFWFTARLGKPLPAGDEAARPSEAPVASPAAPDDAEVGRGLPPGTRVLLAEDNELNQEVAVGILVGWGLDVDVAGNGELAVRKASETDYDIVLMDMHMPGMDGIAATEGIRRLEGPRGRVPIIALTASAMGSDRARCLDAGMNDHVAKPIDPPALWQTLLRWLPAGPRASSAPAVKPAPGNHAAPPTLQDIVIPGLESSTGLRRVGGRTEFYLSLLRRFAEGQAETVSTIRAAVHAGDREAARQQAHALRGMAGTIGALQLQDSAAAVELALLRGIPPTQVETLLATLDDRLTPLVAGIKANLSLPPPRVSPPPGP